MTTENPSSEHFINHEIIPPEAQNVDCGDRYIKIGSKLFNYGTVGNGVIAFVLIPDGVDEVVRVPQRIFEKNGNSIKLASIDEGLSPDIKEKVNKITSLCSKGKTDEARRELASHDELTMPRNVRDKLKHVITVYQDYVGGKRLENFYVGDKDMLPVAKTMGVDVGEWNGIRYPLVRQEKLKRVEKPIFERSDACVDPELCWNLGKVVGVLRFINAMRSSEMMKKDWGGKDDDVVVINSSKHPGYSYPERVAVMDAGFYPLNDTEGNGDTDRNQIDRLLTQLQILPGKSDNIEKIRGTKNFDENFRKYLKEVTNDLEVSRMIAGGQAQSVSEVGYCLLFDTDGETRPQSYIDKVTQLLNLLEMQQNFDSSDNELCGKMDTQMTTLLNSEKVADLAMAISLFLESHVDNKLPEYLQAKHKDKLVAGVKKLFLKIKELPSSTSQVEIETGDKKYIALAPHTSIVGYARDAYLNMLKVGFTEDRIADIFVAEILNDKNSLNKILQMHNQNEAQSMVISDRVGVIDSQAEVVRLGKHFLKKIKKRNDQGADIREQMENMNSFTEEDKKRYKDWAEITIKLQLHPLKNRAATGAALYQTQKEADDSLVPKFYSYTITGRSQAGPLQVYAFNVLKEINSPADPNLTSMEYTKVSKIQKMTSPIKDEVIQPEHQADPITNTSEELITLVNEKTRLQEEIIKLMEENRALKADLTEQHANVDKLLREIAELKALLEANRPHTSPTTNNEDITTKENIEEPLTIQEKVKKCVTLIMTNITKDTKLLNPDEFVNKVKSEVPDALRDEILHEIAVEVWNKIVEKKRVSDGLGEIFAEVKTDKPDYFNFLDIFMVSGFNNDKVSKILQDRVKELASEVKKVGIEWGRPVASYPPYADDLTIVKILYAKATGPNGIVNYGRYYNGYQPSFVHKLWSLYESLENLIIYDSPP